jgi:two-component system, cell cycle response regulator
MTARILVVDDVLANVKLLEARLTAEYFDVVVALSGPEALAICERGLCDIVLLDVLMPDLDGFEVCRRLKANPATHHIPGRHGHRARPALGSGARARSRRRRFPD